MTAARLEHRQLGPRQQAHESDDGRLSARPDGGDATVAAARRPGVVGMLTCVGRASCSSVTLLAVHDAHGEHMAQRTAGLRAILSIPFVYETFQRLVGSPRVRNTLVDRYVGVRPGLRVLDIGCGPGILIEHLPGVAYTGTDVSARYIEAARRKYGDRATFHRGRVEDLDPSELGEFDVVIAKSLIHHIDEDEALHLFEVASTVLAEDGRLVTLDAAYTPDMSRAARFVVSRDRGQSILAPEGYEALARRRFTDVEVEVQHGLLRIPYTHVFMSCAHPRTAPTSLSDR